MWDELAFLGLLFLAFVGLPIAIGCAIYFLPKKLGYPKTASYLLVGSTLIMSIVLFMIVFEDQLFTKNDAKALIEEQVFVLRDDFKFTENSSSSGIGDYYHRFRLEISARDHQKAISIIRESDNFVTAPDSIDHFLYLTKPRGYFGPKIIQNYETESAYIREYFQPSGQEGFAPTF